ncbi:hypothetical protein HK097_001395 [Rhizophlyctis rosea]|uniref:Protein Lines N-terminal domain-containing protein n=1 Tax=Rhizophlyctis rosea TaxID=64517 RepID=A0AAD5S4F7_9FUNG|nr:hypothetical protein HK097_001395 [Rhizophlyctis rosea]
MVEKIDMITTILLKPYPSTSRKAMEVLWRLSENANADVILPLLQHLRPYIQTLLHSHAFRTWFNKQTTSPDYTEFVDTDQEFSVEIVKKCLQILLRALEFVCEEDRTKEERERVLSGLMVYDVLLGDVLRSPDVNSSLVHFFGDNDAQLISIFHTLLEISVSLYRLEMSAVRTSLPATIEALRRCGPHQNFTRLLEITAYDYTIFLDFLASSETSFLEYFVKYLKLVESDVGDFCRACRGMDAAYDEDEEGDVDDGVTRERFLEVWSCLVEVVEKASERGEFPYDPSVLLRRLRRAIEVVEGFGEDDVEMADGGG